jgi:enamine deaminase RidA (YjgF/YER057c/UK114 family)
MNNSFDSRITELNLILPEAPKPLGLYKPALIVDKLVYVSGHTPLRIDGTMITGRLGENMTLEEGRLAARQVGLAIISTLRNHLGNLDKIKRVVKVFGMVNSTPDFCQHPAVINGFSELMVEVFGNDTGVGVRSAVGMFLPMNIAVEVEAVFELK